MRILFLSHSYPPIVGGVETQNYNLAKSLDEIASVTVIANTKGKKALPFFLFYCLIKSLFSMSKYDVCLCGNGVLAPIARILKFYHPKKRFYCVVHGLDITFADRKGILPFIYKIFNISSLKKLDKLFMVGNSTIDQAVKHDISRNLCKFIPNGVDVEFFKETHTRNELEKLLGVDIEGKKIVLRFARFVKHKGSSWFISNVMPTLPKDVIFVAAGNRVGKNTAGDPDDFPACQKAVRDNKLEDQVILLTSVPQESVNILLNTADLVISPNVKTFGTMEGFGLTVIEAGACGRVVIASELEGLADAIQNGKNGILVPQGDKEAWKRKIMAVLEAGDEFIEKFGARTEKYVYENYSWNNIAQQYLNHMKQ